MVNLSGFIAQGDGGRKYFPQPLIIGRGFLLNEKIRGWFCCEIVI